MNYIKRLQAETAAQTREIDALRRGINELRGYLATDKFAADPTVQVRDVESRLLEIMFAATEAAEEEPEPVDIEAFGRAMGNLTDGEEM